MGRELPSGSRSAALSFRLLLSTQEDLRARPPPPQAPFQRPHPTEKAVGGGNSGGGDHRGVAWSLSIRSPPEASNRTSLRPVPSPRTTPTAKPKPKLSIHLCQPSGAQEGKGGRSLKLLGVTLWHGGLGLLGGCHLISPGLRKRRCPAGGWSLGAGGREERTRVTGSSWGEKSHCGSSLVTKWVKELVLSLEWLWSLLWVRSLGRELPHVEGLAK